MVARWLGGPRPSNKTMLTYEGAGSFQLTLRVVKPALRHPRTRDGRSSERIVAVEAPRVARPSLSLATTPGPRSGCRRSWNAHDLHLHTKLWVTAKMARHTSRSNTSPRYAPFRAWSRSDPVMPMKLLKHTATSCNRISQQCWPVAQPLPTLDRNNYASAAGVAKGAYVLADTPGKIPRSSSSLLAVKLVLPWKRTRS